MENKYYKNILRFLSVAFISQSIQAELPKQVQIDKHSKIIIAAHNQNNCPKVVRHVDQLKQLSNNFPPEVYFFLGKCSYRSNQFSKSMSELELFFNKIRADKENPYYAKALDIYTRAEEKLAAFQVRAKRPKTKSKIKQSIYDQKLEQIKIQSGIDFIAVEPECFQMGSPSTELERVEEEYQHKVCITKAYLLGKYEVTQGQWEAVMGANPSHFEKCGSRCPVESVSWDDIQIYIKKLNKKTGLKFRLPTEAEWEYAARAGTATPFSFGENINTSQVNYDGDHPYQGKTIGRDRKTPVTVGSLPANPWGFHEMHGNVWELVQDWYNIGYYKNSPGNNPKGPKEGSFRVRRGGSWRFDARFCRSAYRGRYRTNSQSHILGFRLAANF